MRNLTFTLILGITLAGCASRSGPPVNLTYTGAAPAAGDFRFVSEASGEQPGDYLVRSQVQSGLTARGFRLVADKPRYLVEVAVTARPLNVGATSAGTTVAPAGGLGLRNAHVCAVSLRIVDAGSLAEAYRVQAQQHAPVADCNTENYRLVALAMKALPLRK